MNSSARPPKQPSQPVSLYSFRLLWPAIMILLVCFSLTFWAWRLALQSEVEAGEAQFEHGIEAMVRALKIRLGLYEQVLSGGIALFQTLDDVSRGQWRDFVLAQRINQRLPGIQGIGYASWIPATQLERFTREVREEGFADFAVTPGGPREHYSSILYLEPFDWRNQRAFGYDMYSEPVRRAAMERARDTGRAALSGKVRLVQETDQDAQAGFLIYLPLYRAGAPLESVVQRREALRGWVYAPFRMDDLMQGIMEGERELLEVAFFDAAVAGDEGLMYHSGSVARQGQHRRTLTESIYGHPWTLVVSSSAAFEAAVAGTRSEWVLGFGVLVNLLLLVVLYMIGRHQQRTQHIALLDHTKELAGRLETLIEALPDAIFFKDGGGCWQVVNSAGLRLFGLRDDSWRGRCDRELAEQYPAMAEAYCNCAEDDEQAWRRGERFDTVEEIPAADGVHTFEVTKVPLFKNDGSRQGLVVIGRDISERRRNEATGQRLMDSLRHLSEIAALSHLPLEARLRRALKVGMDHLGLEFAIVSRVVGDEYRIVSQMSPPDTLQDNQVFELANTYCSITLSHKGVLAIHEMANSQYQGHPCYRTFALETYIGAPVIVNDHPYGTVNFTSPQPYHRVFDDGDREFVTLLARWVGSTLEVHLAAQNLAANELQLQTIIDNEPGCVKLLDQEGRVLQMNRAGLEMVEADSLDQVLGCDISELVLPTYREAFNRLTQQVLEGESGTLEFELCGLKQGHRWLETHAVPLRTPQGEISALLAVTLDITERKAAEAEIHRLAFFDPLTSLANRRLLMDRLGYLIRSSARRNSLNALLVVDLDRFKAFNDGLGHLKGDQLLQEVASRLTAAVRSDDTVARIGGDEFVVVLENLAPDEEAAGHQATDVAEKIRSAIAQPSKVDVECRYPISASIGVCLFSGEDGDVDGLFGRADQALYQAKEQGRDRVCLYPSSTPLAPLLLKWQRGK